MTRLEVFKWGILTPLLLKEGLGVVCLNLTPNGMIFSELFPTTPTRVYQNATEATCRGIFLYLPARNVLIFSSCFADKYKNMSLPSTM